MSAGGRFDAVPDGDTKVLARVRLDSLPDGQEREIRLAWSIFKGEPRVSLREWRRPGPGKGRRKWWPTRAGLSLPRDLVGEVALMFREATRDHVERRHLDLEARSADLASDSVSTPADGLREEREEPGSADLF